MTRLAPCESSSVLAGALRLVQASIGFPRATKAAGTWPFRGCYSPLQNILRGTEDRASARMLA